MYKYLKRLVEGARALRLSTFHCFHFEFIKFSSHSSSCQSHILLSPCYKTGEKEMGNAFPKKRKSKNQSLKCRMIKDQSSRKFQRNI